MEIAREDEESRLQRLTETVSECFGSLESAAENIGDALTSGLPGVPDKRLQKDVQQYHARKNEFIAWMGKLDLMIDGLALKHAGKGL
jgi:hypothetical protein